MKIGVISLGCAKNQVGTERMLGLIRRFGYDFTPDPAGLICRKYLHHFLGPGTGGDVIIMDRPAQVHVTHGPAHDKSLITALVEQAEAFLYRIGQTAVIHILIIIGIAIPLGRH